MNFDSGLCLELLRKDLCNISGEVRIYKADVITNTLLKKFVPQQQESRLNDEALQRFAVLNNEIRNFVISDSFLASSLFLTWKDEVYMSLHAGKFQSTHLTLANCLQYGSCGPGASIGTNDSSFLTKMFASTLTCTKASLYRLYSHTISQRWLSAEETRSDNFATAIVRGSNLSTVPKDKDKNRTICTEPVLNMFYQLGAKEILEKALKRHFSIDIRKNDKGDAPQPEINKRLAQEGSIDGSLATIDLKDASDSISLQLCHALLPKDVFEVLMQIRSPETKIGDEYVKLSMISTMGNGFTFPLMTLIFAALVKAIYIHNGITAVNGKNFGVFGDDIIIANEHTEVLTECLNASGFTINLSKSFSTGFFRESCGGDYYKGHDVRGIYIKRVNNEADVYSVFNRLHMWSLRHDISLHNTLVYLKGLARFQPVPGHSSVHEGFIVTRSHLTSPKYDFNGSIFYRSLRIKEYIVKVRDSHINSTGAYLCALGGYVRDNEISLRPSSKKYLVKRLKTPCWDNLTIPGVFLRDLELSWSILLS